LQGRDRAEGLARPDKEYTDERADMGRRWTDVGQASAVPRASQELLDAVDALYTRFLAGSIRNWSLGTETATTLPGLWEKLLRDLPPL